MKQPSWLRRWLWRPPGWWRRRLYRLIAFFDDKRAFKSRGEICDKWEELEERWTYGMSALEAKTGRDQGDARVLARARRERFEQQHDDLISAPERHDSYEEWIRWGQLEGQLMAMKWAMGSKLELPEESWTRLDGP